MGVSRIRGVGSLAGQLVRLAGCRVIGSAGGPDKCRYVVEELGFDACVDHRAGDLEGQVRSAARFVECGMISGYNEPTAAVENLMLIVGKKLTVRGFIVWDSGHREPLPRDGTYRERVVEGIERAFDALLDLLRGGAHTGQARRRAGQLTATCG